MYPDRTKLAQLRSSLRKTGDAKPRASRQPKHKPLVYLCKATEMLTTKPAATTGAVGSQRHKNWCAINSP